MREIPSEIGNNSNWPAMGKVERGEQKAAIGARGINMAARIRPCSFCDAVGILTYPALALIDWEHGMILIGTYLLDKYFRFCLSFPLSPGPGPCQGERG